MKHNTCKCHLKLNYRRKNCIIYYKRDFIITQIWLYRLNYHRVEYTTNACNSRELFKGAVTLQRIQMCMQKTPYKRNLQGLEPRLSTTGLYKHMNIRYSVLTAFVKVI